MRNTTQLVLSLAAPQPFRTPAAISRRGWRETRTGKGIFPGRKSPARTTARLHIRARTAPPLMPGSAQSKQRPIVVWEPAEPSCSRGFPHVRVSSKSGLGAVSSTMLNPRFPPCEAACVHVPRELQSRLSWRQPEELPSEEKPRPRWPCPSLVQELLINYPNSAGLDIKQRITPGAAMTPPVWWFGDARRREIASRLQNQRSRRNCPVALTPTDPNYFEDWLD